MDLPTGYTEVAVTDETRKLGWVGLLLQGDRGRVRGRSHSQRTDVGAERRPER